MYSFDFVQNPLNVIEKRRFYETRHTTQDVFELVMCSFSLVSKGIRFSVCCRWAESKWAPMAEV